MEWTPKQAEAIYNKPNVLVRAAAGSGKTAVLTERIARIVLPDENGDYIDVDRLLVVTFANASAAEMAERLKARLNKELNNTGDDKRVSVIKRQIDLLPNASICTIDSFCIKLVRECFNCLDIDPRFGVLDQKIADKLAYDVLDEVIEELYDEGNESFIRVADLYGGSNEDSALIGNLIKIKTFLSVVPEPLKWLKNATENYSCEEWHHELFTWSVKSIIPLLKESLAKLQECAIYYEPECQDEGSDAYDAYQELLRVCDVYNEVIANPTWEMFDTVYELVYYNYPYSDHSNDESTPEGVIKTLLESVCTCYKEFYNIFTQPSADAAQTLVANQEYACDLYNIYERFAKTLFEEKRKRNMFEFSDIEQMAYDLLLNNPSVRNGYMSQFAEIMIDEYQDTNPLQEHIFSAISNQANRFMVGDMKQSIYGFRRSDPTIFKEKADKLTKGEMLGCVVSLNENFRSRSEVLSSCNEIFYNIMNEGTADIDYNDDERLNVGNKTYQDAKDEAGNSIYTSELVLLEKDGTLSKEALEANYLADRIQSLIGNFTVSQKDGTLRKCRADDIAVLAPSTRSIAPELKKQLEKRGISLITQSTSFFKTQEVLLALNILRIVNNPMQDIPLVAVMLSPLFAFDDNDLAKYRVANKKGCMYDSLVCYRKNSDDDEKLNNFLDLLKKWRRLSTYKKCGELIWTIYMDTYFFEYLALYKDSDRAKRNLELLFQRAQGYESSGFRGLHDFINYLDRIKDTDESEASANLESGSGAVSLMTIHKSKGLEYPVVFVCGLNDELHKSDSVGQMAKKSIPLSLHTKLGVGLVLFNQENMKRAKTLPIQLISNQKKREELAERIRLLYVALTRAREKLILVNAVDKKVASPGEGIDNFKAEMLKPNRLTPTSPLTASTCIDLLAPSILKSLVDRNGLWSLTQFEAGHYTAEEDVEETDNRPIYEEYSDLDEEEYKRVDSVLSKGYTYGEDIALPTRVYVTEVKKIIDGVQNVEWIDDIKPRPSFMQSKHYAGSDIGNTYHAILSLVALQANMSMEHIQTEIERLSAEKLINSDLVDHINIDAIKSYFDSVPGKAMLQSKRVERESRFVIPVPAGDIFKTITTNEQTLLQGIVDCWFDNGDGTAWIVDYKSDSIQDPAEYIKHYKVQLDCYKRAVERLTDLKVTKCFIYSFHLKKAIEV